MTEGKDLWCLFNSRTAALLEGLFVNEVRALLMALPRAEWPDWWIWTMGQNTWQPLESLAHYFPALVRVLPSPHPQLPKAKAEDFASEIRQVITNHKMDGENDLKKVVPLSQIPDLPVEENGEYIPRSHKRFAKRLRVELECQGRKFVTYSIDISVGGVRVEDAIPHWVVGYCKVDLVNERNNEVAELACAVVESQDPKKRFRLEFTELESKEQRAQLEQWFFAA